MSLIRVDHRNCLSDVVGPEHGITTSDMDGYLGAYAHHCRAFEQREKHAWLDLPEDQSGIDAIKAFVASRKGTFRSLMVIGMGGSSLGAHALHEFLRTYHHTPEREIDFRCMDNSDPSRLLRCMSGLRAQETLTIVVSKSGNTLETLALASIVVQWYRDSSVDLSFGMVAISEDNGGSLKRFVDQTGMKLITMPKAVGGRFSVLSSVGMLPAALLGFDIDAILQGAASQRDAALASDGFGNPAYLAALIHVHLMTKRNKRVSVFMPYASRLYAFGLWYAQLWCESLGKARDLDKRFVQAGQSVCVAPGATSQHSQLQLYLEGPNDKLITLVKVNRFETEMTFPSEMPFDNEASEFLAGRSVVDLIHMQLEGTREALSEMGRPNLQIEVPEFSAQALGAMFMHFEMQTAFAGMLLNINPYDQPSVETGKAKTKAMLKASMAKSG